jgi:hypothetical protein
MSNIFCGCILFADDILLLSASLHKLQFMLDICTEFAVYNDMKFNCVKSHLFQVGLLADVSLPKLKLGNNELSWVNELKYLGVIFKAGKKISVNIDLNCRKFLGSSFALLQKCKFLSEEILCKLVLTNCLPMLLYGIDSVFLKCEQIKRMSVAFNTVFRRIFHMSKFSSMRLIYHFLGTKSLDCLYEERFVCLVRNCTVSDFDLLRLCGSISCKNVSFIDICHKYDVHVNMSVSHIKKQVVYFFTNTLNL